MKNNRNAAGLLPPAKERLNMSNIVVTLNEAAMVELQAVLIDRDPAAALEFVEKRIAVQLPCPGASLCDSNRQNPFILRREH